MGAESYFINTKVNNTNDIIDATRNFIDSLHYSIKEKISYNQSWYSINDMLKLQFHNENNHVIGFSLEGCFSWYDESLELSYNIIKGINEKLFKLEVDKPIHIESNKLSNKEEFLNIVKDFYKEKYKYYSDLFKGIKFKTLPDKDFYKKLPLMKFISKFKLRKK